MSSRTLKRGVTLNKTDLPLTTYKNKSFEPVKLPSNHHVLLEEGASIMSSSLTGGAHFEKYSTINRCVVSGPVGFGAFSYVSDTTVGPFGGIGARSSIGAYEHPLNWLSTHHFQWGQNASEVLTEKIEDANFALKKKNPPTKIGPDVWVGANSVVLAGVEMNVGSVLGAGAVLTRDTEAYGIYVGNPAKLVSKRFPDDIIEQLIESKWWDLPLDILLKLEFTDIKSCLRKIRESQSTY